MKIKFLFLFVLLFSTNLMAHTSHYLKFKKIEMEILKDGKVIGYNYYFFTKTNDVVTVKNQIRFKVRLFGVDIFNVEGYGVEKYKDNQLMTYDSKTLQNDKKKFVNLIYMPGKNQFNIKGSSYNGLASANNMIGNWWNHQILQVNSQISPITGSVKKQVVNFLGNEKIEFHGKIIDVDHFKLTSKDMSVPKNKKLDFDIWYDKKKAIIMKVTYSRMGNWEYRLKNYE
tara:strand:- start:289 stop:969 length:681 start_codon:yes stop_codon:yes gene_type:complete